MNLSDTITGFSSMGSSLSHFEQHLLRETQSVKVHQSHFVLPFVIIVAIVYVASLWDDAPKLRLITWVSLIVIAAIVRTLVCSRIEKKLPDAKLPELHSNELWLFYTSVFSTFFIGSGFWWICLDGTDRAVFAVTLLCCVYAIATTINSSVRFYNFPVLVLANLGQAILFLSGVGRSADLEISASIISITLVLIEFGRKNSEIFTNSIRTREEVSEKNLALEKANKDRSHYLNSISHDLAQPLQSLGIAVERLKMNTSDPGVLETVDDLDTVNRQLINQYSSLTELSNLDLGQVELYFTKFRIDKLLSRLVKSVAKDAAEKNLNLVLNTAPAKINSDQKLIESSIRNLVLNAIRYTEKGSISVSTRIVLDGLHVTVSDTGPGIAAKDHERIFDVFYQADNPARSPGEGSGYGLAIVKKNAELLGMEIILESSLGEGASFNLFIPKSDRLSLQPEKGDAVAQSTNAYDSIEGLNILIVDDDHTIRNTLSRLINDWNSAPLTAASMEEAYTIVDNEARIDFAIIDDMLGKNESGLELAEYVSTIILNQPIIVTGNVLSERQLEIEKHGFRVYHKPLDAGTLRKAIATRSKSPKKNKRDG